MQITELDSLTEPERGRLLARIPVFKGLLEQQSADLPLLLTASCLVELAPNETIMRRGDSGRWLYFLVRGGLAVYGGSRVEGEPLNYISPGEMFGDLAWLGANNQRRATVAAEPEGRGALLFACDFRVFGELEDVSRISLVTKLRFLQAVVHSIRWRLEPLRMQQPQHPLQAELRRVPTFEGERGSLDELLALHQQALFLADLLERWNSARGAVPFKLPSALSPEEDY